MGLGALVFAICFGVGWVWQLIGHQVFEKRRPAFVDNIIQLLIGPLFFAAEILFALGMKEALRKEVGRLEAEYTAKHF